MPTIPPTCVPLDPLTSVPLPKANFFSGERLINGPTPDPDNDDVVLVQADDGMVPQDTPSQCPPQAIAKPPNVDPSSLNLHSPSSIVGTPFDLSPRFEYPFPLAAAAPTDVIQEVEPAVPHFHLLSPMPTFPSAMPSLPVPGAASLTTITAPAVKPRADVRNFSPTHLKLQARDPPVPPGLKYRINQNGADNAATIKINGFDITCLTLPTEQGVPRARGVSLSTLTERRRGEAPRSSRPEIASVTKAGGIGEKQARVANKWKRHTLARCESDRELIVVDGAAGAKHESGCSAVGGRPTRVPTRSPIPCVPPTAAPSHRLS